MEMRHVAVGFMAYQKNARVLMFGWELPPHNTGGLGVACMGLARGLSQRGVKISFALPRKIKINAPFMEILEHDLGEVDVTALNSPLKAYMTEADYWRYSMEERKLKMQMYGRDLYEEAVRFGELAANWARNKDHEIVHVHDWMTYPAGIRAKKTSGRPMVAHVHATEYDRTGGEVNSMIADLEHEGMEVADRVIAVSEYTKQVVQKQYGIADEKITVVHNGVDLEEFRPTDLGHLFPNDKVVLYVGRLTRQKGVEYFLKSAKQVLEKVPNSVFLVVGNGDMYQQLMFEAARLGVGHRTIFTGFMQGEKLRGCYEMADVFVMPSVSEPYGIVALEAIASGTPAVISKQSGVSEALEHVMKVDFWDTKKMAEAVVKLIEKPKWAKRLASRALEEARLMSWDAAAAKTIAVYGDLL